MAEKAIEQEVRGNRAKFKVFIRGTLDQVWHELTKTDEVQKAMFNSRLHTPGLEPGAPIRMRTPNGRYTGVAGEVLECRRPLRFSHTFRFTTYDDPPCTVIYDLEQVEGGVELTLTIEDLPAGTKTAKQMIQGGTWICKVLKSVVETGRPPLMARILYPVLGLLEPVMTPKRCLTENWPLAGGADR
jgi:uncharacterized protein YndB with AHSA1/START domain